jgi:outer membrane protein, heavy metal efflux system
VCRFALPSLLLLLSSPAVVRAHDEVPPTVLPPMLTLDDALHLFRERGLDLLIAEAAVQAAEGDVTAAGAVPNPNWNAAASYTWAHDPANTPWGVTVGLGDSNAIEDSLSGKRGLRLKVARAALQAARMQRADAQRTLELSLKQQYITAVLARDTLDFSLEVQKAATQTFELNQLRYSAGAISEADVARVEAAKLEADQTVEAATQALRSAKLGLAFLLGVRGPVTDYHVEQDLPKFVVPPGLTSATIDSLLREAYDHRPDLKVIAAQRDRASAQISLAERLRVPDIGVGVQYQQQAGTSANAAQPPTLTFGLSGTIPLFYFQRGEIARARADYRAQTLQRAKIEAQVANDVEDAFNKFTSQRRQVERMETRLLDRVKRARDLVEVQYKKGAASLLEFLDAQRQYIATNEEYLQDLTNYWIAVYQLEMAVGMELRR